MSSPVDPASRQPPEGDDRFRAVTAGGQPPPEPVSGRSTGAVPPGATPAASTETVPASTVAAQRQRFGGIKWGSAFFGWLTATGTALLLAALAAAAGTGIVLATDTEAERAAQNPDNAPTVSLVGGIVLLVILFLAYYCGGYVAGRMARFNGARQGVAVWVWAVAVAIVVAIVGAIAGSRFDVLANLNGLPRLPINEGNLTVSGIIAAALALAAALIGAVLGGLGGMRFHRKVDRASFEQ